MMLPENPGGFTAFDIGGTAQAPLATIFHGDCLELMPLLDRVSHVISDPPYEDEIHKAVGSVNRVRKDGRTVQDFGFEGINGTREAVAQAVTEISEGWALMFCLAEGVRVARRSARGRGEVGHDPRMGEAGRDAPVQRARGRARVRVLCLGMVRARAPIMERWRQARGVHPQRQWRASRRAPDRKARGADGRSDPALHATRRCGA